MPDVDRDRGGATVLDHLPEELIVDKIFILLPPKEIGCCRLVRKSWRCATSTPQFMLQHHRRQPSLPIVRGTSARYVLLRASSNEPLWPFSRNFRSEFTDGHLYFCAACDGFLIVSQRFRFYICNPVIRSRALLPFTEYDYYQQSNHICGFYQHKLTEEYRVLWCSVMYSKKQATLNVFTVGGNESRSIQVILTPALTSLDKFLLIEKLSHLSQFPPVHHRDNLHWYSSGFHITGSQDILVFDTKAESFRWMHGPAQLRYFSELFDMNGTLAAWSRPYGQYHRTALDIWVVEDYEAEIWVFKCRIDLSAVEVSRPLGKRKRKKGQRNPHYSVVESFDGMLELNTRELHHQFNIIHVLRCNIDSKFLGIVSIGTRTYTVGLTRFCLQETIAPIPSLGMQEEDVEPASSSS